MLFVNAPRRRVFPKAFRAGFSLRGAYGEDVLRIAGKTRRHRHVIKGPAVVFGRIDLVCELRQEGLKFSRPDRK